MVVVDAVVVTALVYAMGVAVTDPVPVTVTGMSILPIVWVVTKLPADVEGMPASGLCCCTGLVTVGPVVETASVLISSAEGITGRELGRRAKDSTFFTPPLFTCSEGTLVMLCVLTCSDGVLLIPTD